jgi:hypothetical protein
MLCSVQEIFCGFDTLVYCITLCGCNQQILSLIYASFGLLALLSFNGFSMFQLVRYAFKLHYLLHHTKVFYLLALIVHMTRISFSSF